MITLIPYDSYGLEESHVHELEKLLKTRFKNIDNFFEDSDGEGDLFFLLQDDYASNIIETDWKWEPKDLLLQIQDLIPRHTITFISDTYDETTKTYAINFTIDGQEHTLNAPFGSPFLLIDFFNAFLDNQQFIGIETPTDSYVWFLAPANLDLSKLYKITGYRQRAGKSSPAPVFKHCIDPNKRFTETKYLNVHIYGRKGNRPTNQLLKLKFFNENNQQDYIRALAVAGDTLSSATHDELILHFGCGAIPQCNDWQYIQTTEYAGKVENTKGSTYDCFDVYVLIDYFTPGTYKADGWSMEWVPAESDK